MKLINLLFLFSSIISYSQIKNKVDAVLIERIYMQTKVLSDSNEIENENPETRSKYLYIINETKDSIVFYDSVKLKPTFYVLSSSENKNEILFEIKNDENIDIYKIIFNDKKNTISVNNNVFTLNLNYFIFLKKAILDKKNVLEFIDFSDDFLSEYSDDLQKTIYISTCSKYKNKDFKIIKANITTKKEQVDNQYDNWSVEYKYKNGELVSTKAFNKNEVRFQKQLMSKNNSLYSFRIYENIDERSLSEGTLKFDLNSNQYEEEGSYLQIGINKETFYKSYLSKEKKIQIQKTPYSPEEIKALFTKYLP